MEEISIGSNGGSSKNYPSNINYDYIINFKCKDGDIVVYNRETKVKESFKEIEIVPINGQHFKIKPKHGIDREIFSNYLQSTWEIKATEMVDGKSETIEFKDYADLKSQDTVFDRIWSVFCLYKVDGEWKNAVFEVKGMAQRAWNDIKGKRPQGHSIKVQVTEDKPLKTDGGMSFYALKPAGVEELKDIEGNQYIKDTDRALNEHLEYAETGTVENPLWKEGIDIAESGSLDKEPEGDPDNVIDAF